MTKPNTDRRTHKNKVKHMAQMALATQKQKHTNTSTKSSTWYTQHGNREPAWRSTFLITLTRAVHMLGMCFAHEYALVRMCLILLCYDQVFWCRRGHVYCLIFNIILRRPHVFWHPLIAHHISLQANANAAYFPLSLFICPSLFIQAKVENMHFLG